MENPWKILEETQPVKLYAGNQTVYLQGETAVQFYYLKKGRVKIYLLSAGGAEKVLSVLRPNRLFGEASFFDGKPRVSSARTLEKSEIISVNRTVLLDCIHQKPQFAMDLLHDMAGTVRMLSAQVDAMSFLQADQRIAGLLIRLEEDGLVPMTHEDLAGLAGVTRVTASRVLGGFAARGWISTRYRIIVIENAAALKGFAEIQEEENGIFYPDHKNGFD